MKMALEACRSEAKSPRDCAAVNNNIGLCEHVNTTGYHYGSFAAHYDGSKGGWQGYLACARKTDDAWKLIGTICDQCAMGASIFDETDETSND
ncbi:MAG: hypothetical protein HY075_04090 [Deltaproteobacteria bacterium]|nr:hypothetical protein [Deltaproteobacteria bacterium]